MQISKEKKTVRQFSQEFSTDLIPFIAFMEEYYKILVHLQGTVQSSGAEIYLYCNLCGSLRFLLLWPVTHFGSQINLIDQQ